MNSLNALSRLLSTSNPNQRDLQIISVEAPKRRKSKKRLPSTVSHDDLSDNAANQPDIFKQDSDDDKTRGESAIASDTDSSDGAKPRLSINTSKNGLLRPPSTSSLRRNLSLRQVDIDLSAPSPTATEGTVVSTGPDRGRLHAFLALVPVKISLAVYVLLRKVLQGFGVTIALPRRLLAEAGLYHYVAPPAIVESGEQPPSYTETIRLGTAASAISSTSATRSRWRLFRYSSKSSSISTIASSPPHSRRSSFTSLFVSSKSKSALKAEKAQAAQMALLARPKTLVLDLDETLIHSTNRSGGLAHVSSDRSWTGRKDLSMRVVEVVLDGKSVVYHVYKRPWVDLFLCKVAAWYTVVIFTASMQEYADPVIDWLDQGRGLIGGRLFRESCIFQRGTYYKDLTVIDSDLSRLCLVDNSPSSYALNQANGIPVEGWVGDTNDECLLDLLPLLDSLRFTADVRRVLGLRGFVGL